MKRPPAYGQDQAALLGDADEMCRINKLIIIFPHADECLGTDNHAGIKIHLRLVMQYKPVLLQCPVQFLLDDLPRHRTEIHFR